MRPDRDRDRPQRRETTVGIDARHDIPVEVQGRWFLLVEMPGAGGPPSDDRALRLLVDRIQTLARRLERAEGERDVLAAECARLRSATAPAGTATETDPPAAAEVVRSWEVPRTLRARRRRPVPGRVRWPDWRR
jgi:hypothetical protein